jgi:hypothetical protein
MNKFNIPEPSGGHRLKAHDLNFIYDSLKEGITGLARAYGNAILYGCRLDPGFTLSEGFVAIDGEVYYFPGATGADYDYRFSVVETTHPLSPRVMDDASSKDIHKMRRVELVSSGGTHPLTMADFGDSWKTIGNSVDSVPYKYANTNIVKPSAGSMRPLRFKKQGDELFLNGTVVIEAFENGMTLFDLPYGYTSDKFNLITVGASAQETSGYQHNMNVWFYANGIMCVQSGSYTGTGRIVLHFNHKIQLF